MEAAQGKQGHVGEGWRGAAGQGWAHSTMHSAGAHQCGVFSPLLAIQVAPRSPAAPQTLQVQRAVLPRDRCSVVGGKTCQEFRSAWLSASCRLYQTNTDSNRKNLWLLETSGQLWVEMVKQNEFLEVSASLITTEKYRPVQHEKLDLLKGAERKGFPLKLVFSRQQKNSHFTVRLTL